MTALVQEHSPADAPARARGGSAEAPAPKRALSTALQWICGAAALLALWGTLRRADLGGASSLVASVGLPITLALVPSLVARAFQAEAFRRIFAALERRASFGRFLSMTLATEAVTMSVPAGAALAESVTCYLLKRRCGIPAPEGVAGIAARRSLILLANAGYVAVALAFGASYLAGVSRSLLGVSGLPWLVLLSAFALLGASLLMSSAFTSGAVASRLLLALRRLPIARVRAWLDERAVSFSATDLHAATLFGARRGELASAAVLLFGMWLIEGFESFLILRLLRVELPISAVLSFEVVLALVRAAAFMVPAGLGVQDAGYVAFLGALGVPDAATAGAAFVLLKRAKEIFWIAAGFLLLALSRGAPPAPEEA